MKVRGWMPEGAFGSPAEDLGVKEEGVTPDAAEVILGMEVHGTIASPLAPRTKKAIRTDSLLLVHFHGIRL